MDARAFAGEFASRIAAELATAIGAATGAGVTAHAADGAPAGEGFALTLGAEGAASGRCTLWIDRAGAVAAARAVLMMDDDPDEATVLDMLREVAAQAASAVCLEPPFAGVRIAIGSIGASVAPSRELLNQFRLDMGAAGAAHLAFAGAIAPAQPAAAGEAAAAAAARAPAPPRRNTSAALESPNLDVVLDIELPLIVRFGHTVMSLKALSGLGPGSIVDMGRSPDDPVELLVSDRVIAVGEVVIVGGNYGIRITDLVSAAERIRALEA